MTATNQADRSLILATSSLTMGRRAQRLTARWAHDPDLNGWKPAELLDALTHRGHDDHDRIVRGLTTRSQHHDEDATVLLLAALRPGLWKLAHNYHRARLSDAFDDLVVNAVHVIARLDPSLDRLYDRILGRVRAATPRGPDGPDEEPVAELDDLPSTRETEACASCSEHGTRMQTSWPGPAGIASTGNANLARKGDFPVRSHP